MYIGNSLDNFDIDVAGKASYKLSNLTSPPSFLWAHHPYIAPPFVLLIKLYPCNNVVMVIQN